MYRCLALEEERDVVGWVEAWLSRGSSVDFMQPFKWWFSGTSSTSARRVFITQTFITQTPKIIFNTNYKGENIK